MRRWSVLLALGLCFVFSLGTPRHAAADWLLTGFIGPLTKGEVTLKFSDIGLPDEKVKLDDTGVGFGVNLAKAWAASGGAGFELDWGVYPKFWGDKSVLEESGRLMTFSPNFFINPSIPRVRPYGVIGPTVSLDTLGVGTNTYFGMNFGGGAIVFAGERGGGRVDVRYFRHFGEGVNINTQDSGANGLKDLSFWRIFFGGTVRLGS